MRPLRCGGVREGLGQRSQPVERRVGGLSATGGHGRTPHPPLVGPQADRRGPRLEDLRELRCIALGEVELRELDLRLDRAGRLVEPVEQRTELERREESVDGVGIEGPSHAVLGPDVQVEVGHDLRQLLVQTEAVDGAGDVLLQLAAEVVHVRRGGSRPTPHSWTSFAAVFSPTPGTPGMLSDVSPFRAT